MLNAQELDKAYKMLDQRGEIIIRFQKPVSENLHDLSRTMSIDKIERANNLTFITAYFNKQQFKSFQNTGVNYEVQNPPSMLAGIDMCPNTESIQNWNCYPTYEQYVAIMESYVSKFPSICRLVEFGQSISGRKLLALKISDNVSEKEAEPEFFYTSSIHGDETTGYWLMIHLIDYLTSNYNSDSRIANLINNTEIWINPLSNPDGTYFGGNSTIEGATRFNSNGYDLNRNFPNPPDGSHSSLQKETLDMMAFLEAHNFVLASNFHGGAEVVNYPWDNWTSNVKVHADDSWYQEISHEYADTLHAHSSGYMLDFDNGITNGGDWYEITGGRQDYMNYFRKSREVTIELSNNKMPVSADLINYWNYNYHSLINYIERVHTGVFGKICNVNGVAIKANVFINNHDFFNSDINADSATGMYYRMLPEGNYTVKYSAIGYISREIEVSIASDGKFEQNVVLLNDSTGDKIIDSYKIVNPFYTNIQISLVLLKSVKINLKLYDMEGNELLDYEAEGIPGTNNIDLPINSVRQGVYICIIRAGGEKLKTKLLRLPPNVN